MRKCFAVFCHSGEENDYRILNSENEYEDIKFDNELAMYEEMYNRGMTFLTTDGIGGHKCWVFITKE